MIYSKRQIDKKAAPFEYEIVPVECRNKIFFLIADNPDPKPEILSKYVLQRLEREHGIPLLGEKNGPIPTQLKNFLLECTTKHVFDVIELSIIALAENVEKYNIREIQTPTVEQAARMQRAPEGRAKAQTVFTNFVEKLNQFFREHSLGYKIHDKQIVRIDSEYLQNEAIEKTLDLIDKTGFEGPHLEFKDAIREYNKGNLSGAIQKAHNSFESTMKSICHHMPYNYNQKDGASKLIQTLFDNKFFAPELANSFSHLKGILESGLPTIRNNLPSVGHGMGAKVEEVERSYTQFALNLSGSYIRFLIERYFEINKKPKI